MSEPKSAAEQAEEHSLTVCSKNNIAPSMLEHKRIAIDAFLAGHAAGRESAGELVEALRAIYPALSMSPDYRKIVDEAIARWKAGGE